METGGVGLPSVISYARGSYDAQVIGLAERLIMEGVPCDVDLFDPRPRGGWSRWMTEKMSGTEIVLVVCSEAYYRRFHLEEPLGVGQGATYESGMLNRRVVAAQGSEHGVIPILFDAADVRWIPEFLRDETHFVLPAQYDDLYRVLTNQPAYVRPPLGAVRPLPPLAGSGSRPPPIAPATEATASVAPSAPQLPLAVFKPREGQLIFVRYADLVRERGSINVTLVAGDDDEVASVSRLRNHSQTLPMGWGLEAAFVRVRSYREVTREGRRSVELVLVEEDRRGSMTSDMSVNGITADQIATRRARRILLDERPVESELGQFSTQRLNEETLEGFVSGRSGGGDGSFIVTRSPLPPLASFDDPDLVEVGRLLCALMLITTNCVEQISRLVLRRTAAGIEVEFVGHRARVYSNQEPFRMTISGVCPIS